jgi:hypothetical protein
LGTKLANAEVFQQPARSLGKWLPVLAKLARNPVRGSAADLLERRFWPESFQVNFRIYICA